MLRLKPAPTFHATVQIPDPSGPSVPLVVEFKHMRKNEWQALVERAKGAPAEQEAEWIGSFIAGWNGCDTAYTPAALADLLQNYPGAALAIADAYGAALFQGRRGN